METQLVGDSLRGIRCGIPNCPVGGKTLGLHPRFASRERSVLHTFETERLLALPELCLSPFLTLQPDLGRYPGDLSSGSSKRWSPMRESLLRMLCGLTPGLRCNLLPDSSSCGFGRYNDQTNRLRVFAAPASICC